MSFIDLMSDVDWSEADVENRRRAILASSVPAARQQELQTILLWHIAGIRAASEREWAEIEDMKRAWTAAAAQYDAALADFRLLQRARAVERGEAPLSEQTQEIRDLVAARARARRDGLD